MTRFLIERASNNEPVVVIDAADEVEAFLRAMSVRELLNFDDFDTSKFNILECLPDEPMPAAPAFSEGYFELQAAPSALMLQ